MTAETIAKALGGRKAGGAWMACCPAHEDRVPSLSISSGRNGKVLVRCHAGCDQRDVIAEAGERAALIAEGPRVVEVDPLERGRRVDVIEVHSQVQEAGGREIARALAGPGMRRPERVDEAALLGEIAIDR